jgi:hypothetical protein
MKAESCVKVLEAEFEASLSEMNLRMTAVGIGQTGPILTVNIGFEPRKFKPELYSDANLLVLRDRVNDLTHRSAAITSDITLLERGVMQVTVNTVPDYCSEGRLKKAARAMCSFLAEHMK